MMFFKNKFYDPFLKYKMKAQYENYLYKNNKHVSPEIFISRIYYL